jgi:hypothetical protein
LQIKLSRERWNLSKNNAGSSSTEEKSFIEQLIEPNLEWKAKYKELPEVHQLMQTSLELDEPSLTHIAGFNH